MSPSRRRRRRSRGSPGEGSGGQAGPAQPSQPPLPEWRWRTMPVFIALSVGLFVGIMVGGPAAAAGGTAATVIFLIAAGMIGISVSRVVMRVLMQRGVIKPQARR